VGVSFVLGIISSKIISVFLGSSGMALMGSFRNFTMMLKSMATLGINNSIVTLFVENKEDPKELSLIYSTFFWLFLAISGLLGITVLFSAPAISSFLFYSTQYATPIRFFGLFLPLMVINTFWLAIYNGLERYKTLVYLQVVSNVLVFAITAYCIWKHQIPGGLFSVALSEVLMVAVTFSFVWKDKGAFQFDLKKIISQKYVQVIQKFSIMALLSAVVVPLTLLLIRNGIVQHYSLQQAGIWDGVNRLSSFYMMFFSSGLSLYYMPKLAAIHTETEFKNELKSYFTVFVPLFLLVLIGVFVLKSYLIKIAFTEEFASINSLLIWQLAGDFFRIMTLAFGFQVVVKTMMKRYFFIEILFNVSYGALSYFWIENQAVTGVVKAYFYANVVCFFFVLFLFRKLFTSR
jgi:O-antigen/teichoic acid export membrane protein